MSVIEYCAHSAYYGQMHIFYAILRIVARCSCRRTVHNLLLIQLFNLRDRTTCIHTCTFAEGKGYTGQGLAPGATAAARLA